MPKNLQQLNKLFDDSTEADKRLNAEQRTNIALYLGNHFMKTREQLSRALDEASADQKSKIRITKNHIFKIIEFITNAILSAASDAKIMPHNENEIQDQKAAELHAAIWDKFKKDSKFKDKIRKLAYDFTIPGEMAVKIFWNPNKGTIVGQEPVLDENGVQTDTKPVFSGDVEIERIFSWDLKRPDNSKSLEESNWLGYEKMVDTKDLKSQVQDKDLKDKISSTEDDTYKIFDPTSGVYSQTRNKTLLREIYFKPCAEYPKGHYYIFTSKVILYEGDLPYGRFPIKVKGFTEVPTSPRSVSIIRQLRPLQVEVNRGASSQALVQMSVGLPKIIMLAGSDLESGTTKAGIRVYKTSSLTPPLVIEGQSGGQFVESMNQAISEMYSIANVPEMDEDKANGLDPQTAMYRSIKEKKRFSLYAEKFSEFIIEICEETMALKKQYMDEREVVRAIGRPEAVNVTEFKNTEDMSYQIQIVEVDNDAASMMGKHISLMGMMQYGGQQMGAEQVALIGRNMPFLNKEEIFAEQLVDYDTFRNIVLALDRGEDKSPIGTENSDYLIPKLTTRTHKADFKLLDPVIQQRYMAWIQQLQQISADRIMQLKQLESELYPVGGPTVPIPIYREVIGSQGQPKSERVQVPMNALEKFVQILEQQGQTMDPMLRMQQVNQAKIAQLTTEMGPQAQPIQPTPAIASGF